MQASLRRLTVKLCLRWILELCGAGGTRSDLRQELKASQQTIVNRKIILFLIAVPKYGSGEARRERQDELRARSSLVAVFGYRQRYVNRPQKPFSSGVVSRSVPAWLP
jgi:hypothetical protein